MKRRAVILPAVLVTLAVGAMIGATALFYADAGRRGAAASLHATQVRALGWSGVQAAMAELASQRDDLLSGEAPQLTSEWVAFSTEGGRAGLFRLLPIGPAEQLAVSETAKLDLNHAPVESIAALPGLTDQLAAAIVAARPLGSMAELLDIEGITPETLYGADPETSASQGVAGLFAGDAAAALADTATVYSFDPNIQSGVDGVEHRGDRRLNLNVEWNERLGRALDRRFGAGTGEGVREIMKSGQTFQSESDFVQVLRFFQLQPADWVAPLDALTASDDEFLAGRVDMNLAPAETLAALPGIDDQIARRIVDAREATSPSTRQSVCWPVLEELMTPEQFQEAVDHLTTRSTQWRIRVEAGLTAPGAADLTTSATDLEIDEFGVLVESDGRTLERRIVLDAVIDVASRRPRVAYLRDITHVELERVLRAQREPAPEQAATRAGESPEPSPPQAERPEARDHLVDMDFGRPAPVDTGAPEDDAAPDDVAPEDSGAGAAPGDEPVFVDRRRGRWTAGGGS
ncbi:MAG: ComEA family DNA-binding protein [Phycisphaerales bacterium JB039]